MTNFHEGFHEEVILMWRIFRFCDWGTVQSNIFLNCSLCVYELHCLSIKAQSRVIAHRLMAYIITITRCTFCGLGLALDANGKNRFQLRTQTSKHANTLTLICTHTVQKRTHITYHGNSPLRFGVWKWETHQSGSRVQCRATGAGLVVTAVQICC